MNTILEQFNSMGKSFVEFAFPVLVQSSVLIVILLLVDLLLRRRVRAVFRYFIWMLVLAKLVLPSSLSSPLSLGYLFGDRLGNVTVSSTTTTAETMEMLQPLEIPGEGEAKSVEAISAAPTARPATKGIEPVVVEPAGLPAVSVTQVSWQGVVFLVWLGVVVVMMLLLLQRAIFVSGLVAQAKEANNLMTDALSYCCRQMGMKGKVGLKVSANATSPAVCGLFRPVILVPQNLGPGLGAGHLRTVLLHELAHIKRGDLWVNLVQTILQIIYFYSPLLWLANAVIRRVREQAVDETVQVAMGEKAQQYPETLLNVAKLAFKRPTLSLRLIGVVESKSALKGRIKHMLNRPIPKSAKLGLVGLIAIFIIGAVLLPMAKAERADVQVESKTDSLDQLGNAPEEVRAIGKVLKEWFDAYRAGDSERAKKLQHPEMINKLERNLDATKNLSQMISDETLSIVAVIQHEEGAHVAAGTVNGIFFLGEPFLIGGVLNKFQGQWWINNISGTKLETFQEFIEHSKQKYPDINIWLSDSYSKLQSRTDIILKKKAESFEKTRWEQLNGAPKDVQEIAAVLRRWFAGFLAGDLEEFKALYAPNARRNAEKQLKELQRYAITAPDWQFSPMVIRIGDSRADAISHDFVITSYVPEYSGDPVVIIVQLMKVDGQWEILGWSGDSLRSISHAHFQRKYPQSRIWFDKSIPDWLKPDQQTDVDVDIEELKGIAEKVKPGYSFAEKVRAITGDKEIFESYFTDSIEGGKALDQWWPKRSEDPDVDKKIFGMVRNGLRRDSQGKEREYRNQYIKWVGLRYIWGKKPQNKEAIELMYYATFDPQLASDAVYHGLSVVRGKKSDKILRRFVELCMANVNVNRILWGTKGQHEDMLQYLEPYLTSSDLEIKNRASVLEKVFKGEINYTKWETEQRRQKRQAEFGEKLPEIREVLLRGNSHQRRELFDLIRRKGLHILFDESFAEPLKACLEDGAPAVREAAIGYSGDLFGKRGECSDEMLEVMNNLSKDWDHKIRKATAVFIGSHWIWGVEPQNPKAIEIMMELSKDKDRGVRNQAVYYGLSVVENKSDKVIKRLIEMALDAGASSDLGRIGWGLGRGADKEKIKMYLMPYLELENRKGERARQLYREIFKAEPPNSPKEETKENGLLVKTSALQSLIDAAQPGGTVIVPAGVYTEPIEINKSLTLKGQSLADSVFEVTANKPVIFIDTKGKGQVTVEDVTIKWQLATSDKSVEYPFALGVKDSKVEVKNCSFVPLGNFKRSPVGVKAIGFSNVDINACRFEGFGFPVFYNEGTEGAMRDSLITNCQSQGITLFSGTTVSIVGNIITGSNKHAVRNTGGTLRMHDNLIINNANRGVYLGNKSARGTITNNIIMGNGTGISGFARSKVKIENNLILDNSFAGIDMRDSCSLLIHNNILQGNGKGLILFKEGSKNSNRVFRNTFWKNTVNVENFDETADSIEADPRFVDPDNGDFSLRPGLAKERKQGLTNPQIFKMLWKRWQNREDENEPFTEDLVPKEAIDSAQAWLKLVDDGDYGQSWQQAAQYLKSAVSKDQFQKSVEPIRGPLGKVISREVKSKRYTKQLPGAPDGEYVVIEFDTSFENKSSAIETVTPMLDKDGLWRVSGYYIK